MRFVHRFSLRLSASQRRELEALGLKVPAGTVLPGGGAPHVALDVGEDHPNWPKLHVLFQQWGAGDFLSTEFSKKELAGARWLELMPGWHHGYPQPDEDGFGYRAATYDLTGYCKQCGIGLRQRAPFQMKAEPKWGRNSILQLNWVFDEYFVTPAVWKTLFEPQGIACRPVLNTNGAELDTSEPAHAVVKTKEYFGSGAAAHKRVLVSRELARALDTRQVRGASVRPVRS